LGEEETRIEIIGVRVTPSEKKLLIEKAKRKGLKLSDYVRKKLLSDPDP